MAKVSFINQHDWMAVRVTFPDGGKANVTWNRGGHDVLVDPKDPQRAEVLSLIVAEATANTRDPKTGFLNLGQVAKTMQKVAEGANSLNGYLDGLKDALGVTGARPAPKGAANAPAATQVECKPSRGGYHIKATFPNGERLDLKLNRSSISLGMDPDIVSRGKDVSNFIFGVKQMGMVSDHDLASALETSAREADSIDGWFEQSRNAVAALSAPKP